MLCLGFSFSSMAQEIENRVFTITEARINFSPQSSLEGGGSCDARFTPIFDGKEFPAGVVGYNGFMEYGAGWKDFSNFASIGGFDINKKHTLAFKIWENDCGEAWKFESSCGILGGDDDHGVTPTITIDTNDFEKRQNGNYYKEYTITKEGKGDRKGKDNAGYTLKVTIRQSIS